MVGWIIFGAVVLLIVILLICPIAVYFEYGEDIILKVKYLFFTIFRYPPKTKKQKRKDKKELKAAKKLAKAEKSAENGNNSATESEAPALEAPAEVAPAESAGKSEEKKKEKPPKKPKPTLDELLEVVKVLAESLGKPLKKLLKRTRIYLQLDVICGGDDAAAAALNYGKMNLVVGNALGWLDTFFTLVKPDVNIGVDFEREDTQTELFCKINLSLGAALAFLLVGLFRIVVRSKKNDKVLSAVNKLRGAKK